MDRNRCRISFKIVDIGTARILTGFMFTIVLALSLTLGQTAIAQKVFVQTGFEKETLGKPQKIGK